MHQPWSAFYTLDQLPIIGMSGSLNFCRLQLFYRLCTRRFGGKVRSFGSCMREGSYTDMIFPTQKSPLSYLVVLFGPSFTCIFFATILMQGGDFSLKNWGRKIKQDLPGAWIAGLGFWPIVDLLSYSVIPVKWIPLFVNVASFIWTIYLSLVANKQATPSSS